MVARGVAYLDCGVATAAVSGWVSVRVRVRG